MADQYVDAEYVRKSIGYGYVQSAEALGDIDTLIEQATALVQSYLRNNGYATPATTTDVTVKLAVIGAVWELLTSMPEVSVKLPENWKEHPARIAYAGILDGSATVTHALTTASAIGGSKFTASVTGQTDARPARATRDNLSGY